MKNCPFCKAEIPADALKCKHCGEWVDGRAVSDSGDRERTVNVRWEASEAQMKAMHGLFLRSLIPVVIMFVFGVVMFLVVAPKCQKERMDDFKKRTNWGQQESDR